MKLWATGRALASRRVAVRPRSPRIGIGLRSGDGSDDKPIRRNHAGAENILKLLEIEIDWRPSA